MQLSSIWSRFRIAVFGRLVDRDAIVAQNNEAECRCINLPEASDSENYENILFSKRQVQLLRRTWASLGKNKEKFVEMSIDRLFNEHKRLKYIFVWDMNTELCLTCNRTFAIICGGIALEISNILDDGPNCLAYKNSAMYQRVLDIGGNHRRFIGHGLTLEQLWLWRDYFLEDLEALFQNHNEKEHISAAWKLFVGKMMEITVEGFENTKLMSYSNLKQIVGEECLPTVKPTK